MKQRLKQILSQRYPSSVISTDRVPAAVLVPIYYKQGDYYILFTKRTETVKEHKGQISFPGGTYEEQDGTLVNTVLRECAEEIGLVAEAIELLGELDDTVTKSSGYIISPFVANIRWPYPFKENPTEVEAIIKVPISALLDKNCMHQDTEIVEGKVVTTYFYNYQGNVIWGATARILNQFLVIFSHAMEDAEE
ncbi:NUDIX hydrolase [Chloroflexota bacterium]